MISMIAGHKMQKFISLDVGKYIGAILLLLLGLFTLIEGIKQRKEANQENIENKKVLNNLNVRNLIKVVNNPLLADIDHENDIKPIEGIILGIAVAMDASIAAFTLSFFNLNPYITPFLFGLTHFVLIGLGNFLAKKISYTPLPNGFHYCQALFLLRWQFYGLFNIDVYVNNV